MVHQDVPHAGPVLRVDDTLSGLTRLGGFARWRFGEGDGRVVAVTGSVGKTTTKEMLRCALSAFGVTHAAVASYNNHWGVPLTLARTPRDARFCIAEIGMNHAGEIAPLGPPGPPARRRHHHDRQSACRPSGQHRGDRRREGQHHAWPGTQRHRRAAGRFSDQLPRLRAMARCGRGADLRRLIRRPMSG